ncbi:hypothetical protein I4U23_003942 [Adineta vaga]|nr:hypothetical protein I4U23_003942 [Adineta vaga]
MVSRNYNATRIYGALAKYIENPLRNGSIQCYDAQNNIITCYSNESCSLRFDTKNKKVTSRGCDGSLTIQPRVFLFDGDVSPALNIGCNKDLCNNDETINQVTNILYENGVTDANARRIAAGTKDIASVLLVTITFIFSSFFHF